MAHPCDDGRLGTLLDWNAFGPSNRSAADGSGVIGNRSRQLCAECCVNGVKVEELNYRVVEISYVFVLDLITTLGCSRFAFEVAFGGAFCGQFRSNLIDRFGRSPDTAGERPASFLLFNDPVFACSFAGSTTTWRTRSRFQV